MLIWYLLSYYSQCYVLVHIIKIKYNVKFLEPCLGGRILSVEVPKDQIYPAKFKGIAVCFSLLKVYKV